MCGHFGCMGPGIVGKDLEILEQLGIVSQLRGRDGAGVFQVRSTRWGHNQNTYSDEALYKTYMPFSSMLHEVAGHKEYQKRAVLNSIQVDVIMGHVRASTKGVISDGNAHPFNMVNIVGAHNGTLKDQKYLGDPRKTDSELMFRDIDTHGLSTTLNQMDNDSAFAIVLYDRTERAMFFTRNELRTLSFAFIKGRSVMYWASDSDMLRYILHRNGETDYKMYHLRPRVVIKIKASDINQSKFDDPLEAMELTEDLTIGIPTIWKKIYDDREKKRLEEEAKKNVVVITPPPVNTEATGQTSFLDKKAPGPNLKVKKQEVQKDTGKFSPKGSYTRCACGSTTLNLLQGNVAMRGLHKSVTYNKTSDTFHCDLCREEPGKEIQHEERAVG